MLNGFLSAAFWGVLLLSGLVFVHEGGHFVMARLFGMRVTEFFLGLPARWRVSFKSKRFGTEFGVTPVLLGGYNRICGMEAGHDELAPRALAIVQAKGRVRAADLASELGVEEHRAYQILARLHDLGSIRPYYDPELGEHPWQSDWPQAFETIARDADLLTEYDSDHDFSKPGTTGAAEPHPVDDAEEFYRREVARTYEGKSFLARVATLCAGPAVNILLAFCLVVGALTIAGTQVVSNSNQIGAVALDSLAEAAGLKEGDVILKVGSSDVASWTDLQAAAGEALGQGGDITIAYERGGETFETVVEVPDGEEATVLGLYPVVTVRRLGLIEASAFTLSYIGQVVSMIVRLFVPTHTMEILSQSSSIVGISAMASEAAASGPNDFVLFAAAVSLSLGLMNLLPIPPLDGGKILIEVVQLAIGRPLSVKVQNIVSYVGLAFFLLIFCFALRNDIMAILG